jgi:ribosomal protein S18 acetylase RimI-like enzyme
MRPMTIHTRRAEGRDMERLGEIYAAASSLTFPDEPPENSTAERLFATIGGEDIWLAEWHGQIAGFVSVWRPAQDRFIHHLYVDPQRFRRGIGRALIDAALRATGGRAALKADLSNPGACRFYDQLGWRPAGWGCSPEGPWILYVR